MEGENEGRNLYENKNAKKSGRVRRFVINTLFVGAVLGSTFTGGYFYGARKGGSSSALEQLASKPIAKNFLDYPTNYSIDVRLNKEGEREAYLQDKKNGEELPLISKSWELIDSYQGNGKLMMEGAMKTIKICRSAYGGLGGKTEGAKPIANQNYKK